MTQTTTGVPVSFEVGENVRLYTTYRFEVSPEDAARIAELRETDEVAALTLLRELYDKVPYGATKGEDSEYGDLADDPQTSLLEVTLPGDPPTLTLAP